MYALALAFLASALWIAATDRNVTAVVVMAGVGLLCWLLLYQKVRSEPSPTAVTTVPVVISAPLGWRWLEALLLFVVVAITPIIPGAVRNIVEAERVRASVVVEGQWNAGWLADHALEFQRLSGRAPASALEILERFVQPETLPNLRWSLAHESGDPWQRAWVLRVDPGEAWVCSRGPSGAGACPAGRLTSLPVASAGTLGYSTKLGPWGDADRGPAPSTVSASLAMAAWFLPIGAYAGYRLIRRAVRRPVRLGRRLAMWTCIAAAIPFVYLSFTAMHNEMHVRSLSARAGADIARFNEAIARYRAGTRQLPPTLSSLAERPSSTVGQATPIIDKENFPRGMCKGAGDGHTETLKAFYTYRRWSDGRYFIMCPQPFHASPTVMARGSAR